MADTIPRDIQQDLERACDLHQRATSDYDKCLEFNKLMSDVLGRLEDAGCDRTADKVMSILLDCNPRAGSSCDKATRVGDRVNKLK